MSKSIQIRDRVTISKVKLTNFEEDLKPDNQMCAVELGYVKEVLDEEGAFQFAKEYPTAKLRNFLAHDDLVTKFDKLRPHLALICEYDNADNYTEENLDESDFDKMFVTQVTITGDNENAGVVLTGFRLLADGSKLNLVTPNLKFEHTEYRFSNELSEAVDELTAEALLCLSLRKRKIVQAEIFDNDGDGGTDDEFGQLDLSLDDSVEKLKKTLRKGGVKILVGESS